VFRKFKKTLVYLLIAVVPFVFLFFSQNHFINFKAGVVASSSWPVQVVLFPFRELKKIIFYHQTYADYEQLKKDIDPLKQLLLNQDQVVKENLRLAELLDFKRASPFRSVAAKVIMRDPTNWAAVIIIDKGAKQGIKQGMPVVTPTGVVGKITEVGQELSKVTLLTDPRFSVAAVIERTREQGLVSGTLRGNCRLQYLPVTADVVVGDYVITSNLSSFFSEGLRVGRIVSVQESFTSPTFECLIKPAVPHSRIEEVIVILSRE
jgi:rod shape-determining protein MreC